MPCGWCASGVDCPRHPSGDEGDRSNEASPFAKGDRVRWGSERVDMGVGTVERVEHRVFVRWDGQHCSVPYDSDDLALYREGPRSAEDPLDASIRKGAADRYAASSWPGRNEGAVAHQAEKMRSDKATARRDGVPLCGERTEDGKSECVQIAGHEQRGMGHAFRTVSAEAPLADLRALLQRAIPLAAFAQDNPRHEAEAMAWHEEATAAVGALLAAEGRSSEAPNERHLVRDWTAYVIEYARMLVADTCWHGGTFAMVDYRNAIRHGLAELDAARVKEGDDRRESPIPPHFEANQRKADNAKLNPSPPPPAASDEERSRRWMRESVHDACDEASAADAPDLAAQFASVRAEATAAEREACARIADEVADRTPESVRPTRAWATAAAIAKAIRQRAGAGQASDSSSPDTKGGA